MNFCLARVTQKSFFPASRLMEEAYFSMYQYGVNCRPEELMFLLPEKVLIYLANRIQETRPRVWVNYSEWSSGPHFFTDDSPVVLLIQEKLEYIMNARNNCIAYMAKANVDFVLGSIDSKAIQKVDLVYLHPRWIDNFQKFSLLTHTDINSQIKWALKQSDSVLIVLPSHADVGEIAQLISQQLRVIDSPTIKIEIQNIIISGTLKFFIVYIGEIAKVQNQDELETITKFILDDRIEDNEMFQATYSMLSLLKIKVTVRNILDKVMMVSNTIQKSYSNESMLQKFILECLKDEWIEKEEIEKLFLQQEQNQQQSQQINTPFYKILQTPATFNPQDLDHSPAKSKFVTSQLLDESKSGFRKVSHNISLGKIQMDISMRNATQFVALEHSNKLGSVENYFVTSINKHDPSHEQNEDSIFFKE